MKTTMELPDELFNEVRAFSRNTGVTMRELVVEGLRKELASRRAPRSPVDFVFSSVGGQGLREGLEPAEAVATSYGLPPS